jgi:ADP-ribose pyrophosphatase
MEEKTVKSTLVYQGRILDVYEDEVIVSNGNEAKRVVIKHNGAAAILPITKEGLIVLTRQYRYPLKQITLEIPAGKLDSVDEASFDCAKRELEEETSFQSNDITFMLKIHNAVGYSNEFIDIYLARDCFVVEDALEADEDEVLENVIVSVEEALDLIESGKITDVKTIVAIYQYMRGK